MTCDISAQEGELGDEGWIVEERTGRIFYFTHGTAVWGHEFGFFKDPHGCNLDILWLTLSSSDEKVKDFVGKDVLIQFDVDGRKFHIEAPMLNVFSLAITQIMFFTNIRAEQPLMEALSTGSYVKVRILGPKELEALIDIKEDQFSLTGFTASRTQAATICRGSAPAKVGEPIIESPKNEVMSG